MLILYSGGFFDEPSGKSATTERQFNHNRKVINYIKEISDATCFIT